MVDQLVPRIKENIKNGHTIEASTLEETLDITNHKTPKVAQIPETNENEEISINYVHIGNRWNRNNIVVDNVFIYNIVADILKGNENLELRIVKKCQH